MCAANLLAVATRRQDLALIVYCKSAVIKRARVSPAEACSPSPIAIGRGADKEG